MARLNDAYKKLVEDLNQNIKNKEDLAYVKEKLADFVDIVIQELNGVVRFKEDKMDQLEQTQRELDAKINKMQQILDNIEKDIYSDEGFDFEIICPYCNAQFVVDIDENRTEVECPECKNMIELDWTGDTDDDENSCSGHCSGCSGCDDEQEDEEDNEDDM